MPHRVIHLDFLAPVPVGHRVELEFYEHDVGLLDVVMKVDEESPVVVDVKTGIRWHDRRHFGPGFTEGKGRLVRTETARVVACDVQTYGPEAIGLRTRLTLGPARKARPQGPYRTRG